MNSVSVSYTHLVVCLQNEQGPKEDADDILNMEESNLFYRPKDARIRKGVDKDLKPKYLHLKANGVKNM